MESQRRKDEMNLCDGVLSVWKKEKKKSTVTDKHWENINY